jgi:ABC-type tungstate transport system permease subunit
MSDATLDCRYFLATSGVKLPLKLVNEIEAGALSNRNTYIRAFYDAQGRLQRFEKMVYGDVELSHIYDYDAAGQVRRAEILMLDEDPTVLNFDENGQLAPA